MNKRFYHWLVVICCCGLSTASIGLCVNCAGVFFAPVAQSLNAGIGDVSVFLTIVNLTNGFLGPVAVKLTKKVDIRILIGVSAMTACACFICLSHMSALWQMYILAVLLGASNAFYGMVMVTLLIGNWFQERMGLAVGISLSFSGLMGAIMSPVFGSLIGSFGWRSAYLAAAIVVAAATIPSVLFVRLDPAEKNLLPYGATEQIVSIQENSAATQRGEIISPQFVFVLAVAVFGAAITGFGSHMSGYSTDLGLSATVGAYMISAVMMGNTSSKLVIGMLSDAIGPKKACTLMIGLSLTGFIALIGLADGHVAVLAAAAFLVGTSYCVCGVGLSNLSKQLFGESFAAAYSYITAASFVGSAVSVATIGYSYDLTGTYYPSIVVCILLAAICIGAIVLAYKIKNTEGNGER